MTSSTPNNAIILVTGSNQGLGYNAIQTLLTASKPYTILLGSRSLSRGQTAASDLQAANPNSPAKIIPLELDISNDESIAAATKKIEADYGYLDILVNNAGIASASADDAKLSEREILSTIYNTNVFGTYVLTTFLLPLLKKSPSPHPRLIFVSSRLGSMAANSLASPHCSVNTPALLFEATIAPLYRTSKSALNGFAVYFDNLPEVRERGVRVLAVCPGYCATNLNGHSGHNTAASGGAIIAGAALGTLGDVETKSGVFVEEGGKVLQW